MKILEFDTLEDWLQEGRAGNITGSTLKDIVVFRGNEIKDAQYELLAERLSMGYENGSSREDGHTREAEALNYFAAKYNKKLDYVKDPEDPDQKIIMWVSDRDPRIRISPDAGIKNKKGIYTEACEVKCLSGKHHMRAIIENKLSSGFRLQVIQYFIVNEDLKKLYFIFYDPRITAKPMHVLEFTRKELEEEIELYTDYQDRVLAWVDEWAERLAF